MGIGFDSTALVAGGLGLLVGVVLPYLFGHHRRAVERADELRHKERAEADRALSELRQGLQELTVRTQEQAAVFQMLPELVGNMFSARGRRSVGPQALELVEKLLRPEQAALFVARPARRRLALAAGKGLPQSLALGTELDYGSGRIGYVADNRLAMDNDDFGKAPGERATDGSIKRLLEGTGFKGLRADVVVPMEADGALVGVLCVAGSRARRGQEKRLLEMAAGLTAIALTHVLRLRAAEEAADLDGLTGVYNWSHFERRLQQEVERAEREKAALGLLLIDVDHFANYNDQNGHIGGDALLKRLAQLLKDSIRDEDLAARFGGEEFAVLFRGSDKATTLGLAEDIRHAVEQASFSGRERQPLGAVTVSGGIAAFPEDTKSAGDLVRRAEAALYEAKTQGRNRLALAEAVPFS
jgi:diguanylate cyclase (GGDEF)-like protein